MRLSEVSVIEIGLDRNTYLVYAKSERSVTLTLAGSDIEPSVSSSEAVFSMAEVREIAMKTSTTIRLLLMIERECNHQQGERNSVSYKLPKLRR